jgi:S1-C subfamily serine protease
MGLTIHIQPYAARRGVPPRTVRAVGRWVAQGALAALLPLPLAGQRVPDRPPPDVPATTGASRLTGAATGSGFVVTADGYIVTNRHVVAGCRSLAVRTDSAPGTRAQVVALHPRDDLAIIRTDTSFGAVAAFRVGAGIRPGDDIVAVGFPLAGLLADEPNVTTGSVSALAGIHNNPSVLQMSAPVQQGSSGGPLFDASGNVVGVVVTKLNARIVAEETGDLPQNVNFALKGDIARAFLETLAIPYRSATSSVRLANADVGDIGRRVTVLVECDR